MAERKVAINRRVRLVDRFSRLALVRRAFELPSEVYAEVFVEPPIVGLEEIFQPAPGRRIHALLVGAPVTLTGKIPGLRLLVGQIEELEDELAWSSVGSRRSPRFLLDCQTVEIPLRRETAAAIDDKVKSAPWASSFKDEGHSRTRFNPSSGRGPSEVLLCSGDPKP